MRIVLIVVCLVSLTICQYDYRDQGNWPGACQNGVRQSPININTRQVYNCSRNVGFKIYSQNKTYTQTPKTPKTGENLFTNFTLSTIQRYQGRAAVQYYDSLQFHFHRYSEHTIDGSRYDLQLHIVHKHRYYPNHLAVYAILFEVRSGTFKDPFDDWNLNTTVNIDQYFPINLSTPYAAFHYLGSLTTPSKPTPCAQIVQWFVNGTPIPIKKSSFDQMVKLIYTGSTYGNWRSLQSLNERTISGVGTQCSLKRRRNFLRRQK